MEVTMTDHLKEVGRFGRAIAIVGLGFSTLLFVPVFLLIVANLIFAMPANPEKARQMVGQAVVGGLFGGVSLWMFVRLLLDSRARNGITTMPLLFIELCGVVMLIATLFFAIKFGSIENIAGAFSVFGAMILVRSRVRAKLREQEERRSVHEQYDDPDDDQYDETDHERVKV